VDYEIEYHREYKGYEMVGIMTNMGHRCGYVAIPRTHLFYKYSYFAKYTGENGIGKTDT